MLKGKMLRDALISGGNSIQNNRKKVDQLNVYPVPDGDTGTNMSLTMSSAVRELELMDDSVTVSQVADAAASALLRGARGNSGVILSQLFRGFTKSIREKDALNVSILADAFEKAVETAYKAVMKPKEGTILTVARGASERARELAEEGCEDLNYFFDEVIKYADEILERTPEMLPVLKQAGVVDSGGQGLMQVLKGAYDAFLGKEFDLSIPEVTHVKPVQTGMGAQAEADIKFGYCTEFIIMLTRNFNIKQEIDFKEYLESIGDSIVVVADDDVVKVHVHTNDPGLAIQKALKYGALSNMKIDNMRLEHQEKLFKQQEDTKAEDAGEKMPHKEIGFIAVSAGEGINEIFRGLGVDYIIEGGQTMNPSTEDMLNAIDKVNADTVFILPNNKNIILAANQAKAMTEDKEILVIPTKTIPQGITAIINYVPDLAAGDNAETMNGEIGSVKTGQVTYAVRDTVIEDKEIRQGDYMGIGDSGILSVDVDVDQAAFAMIQEMMDDSLELISIYYGAEVSEEAAKRLRERVAKAYPSCDVELQYGGQPIYYYIVSAE